MKNFGVFVATAIAVISLLAAPNVHARKLKVKIPSKDSTIGKATQKVKPREIKETKRPDGAKSVVTGQVRNKEGKIVGPHSHSVTKDGEIVYSRTAGGNVVIDRKAENR